jgi:hypothetical protein
MKRPGDESFDDGSTVRAHPRVASRIGSFA